MQSLTLISHISKKKKVKAQNSEAIRHIASISSFFSDLVKSSSEMLGQCPKPREKTTKQYLHRAEGTSGLLQKGQKLKETDTRKTDLIILQFHL